MIAPAPQADRAIVMKGEYPRTGIWTVQWASADDLDGDATERRASR
jgi:hypothetical protein